MRQKTAATPKKQSCTRFYSNCQVISKKRTTCCLQHSGSLFAYEPGTGVPAVSPNISGEATTSAFVYLIEWLFNAVRQGTRRWMVWRLYEGATDSYVTWNQHPEDLWFSDYTCATDNYVTLLVAFSRYSKV